MSRQFSDYHNRSSDTFHAYQVTIVLALQVGMFFQHKISPDFLISLAHGLRTPGEEITFTARPKIKSQSQIYRYGQSIICLPHRPKISGFFDLCLHWVSVVRGLALSSFMICIHLVLIQLVQNMVGLMAF